MSFHHKRLSTVRNLTNLYPDADFTQNSIRWLIFNAKENGFSMCIVRLGRKVLIDLDKLDEWLDSQAVNGAGL